MPGGARLTSESITKGNGLYQAIWISAGQTVKLHYMCDNYGALKAGGSGYNCEVQFVRKYWHGHINNLMFFQTDPGSGYCGAPQYIIDRTTLRGTRERQVTLPHRVYEYRKT